MEKHLIDGNERILETILAMQHTNAPHAAKTVAEVLRLRMAEGGALFVPVSLVDQDDISAYRPKTVSAVGCEGFLPVFATRADLLNHENTAWRFYYIDDLISLIAENDTYQGLLIDPGKCDYPLSKANLQGLSDDKTNIVRPKLPGHRLINEAICFAVEHHGDQLRKGAPVPYILHPLEAMNILFAMGADAELLAAGVLHDTVEDTDATIEQVAERFGIDVASLVFAHTENKNKTWKERKKDTLYHAGSPDRRLQKLILADKVSNLRSLVADRERLGDKLWDHFHAPKDMQSWYYRHIENLLIAMSRDKGAAPFYEEMVRLRKKIF